MPYLVHTIHVPSNRTVTHDGPTYFGSYGDANRAALDTLPTDPGVVSYVRNADNPDRVLVAYASLSELPSGRGKVAMVDGACGVPLEKLPSLVAETIAWHRAHYARKAG